MNKKLLKAMTLSLSCAMLASIGLVAACGEGGGGGDIDLDENGNIRPGQDGSVTTLTFWGYGDENEVAVFEELVNKFNEENKGVIQVKYVPQISDGYGETAGTGLQSSRATVDVLYVGEENFKRFAEYGYLEPLDDYIKTSTKVVPSDMWDSSINRYKYDVETTTQNGPNAHYWGIPKDVGPTVIFYNETYFNNAGVKVISVAPEDLDKFNSGEADARGQTKQALGLTDTVKEKGYFIDSAGQKWFNNRVPMSWEECVALATLVQTSERTRQNKTNIYGYQTEWWFNYGWTVGGDCIEYVPDSDPAYNGGWWDFTLMEDTPNYIVADDAQPFTVNGNTYQPGEIIAWGDKIKKESLKKSGKTDADIRDEVKAAAQSHQLNELPSQRDAFVEFVRVGQLSTKEVEKGLNGYGICPSPTSINGDSGKTAAFQNGQLAMLIDGRWNVVNFRKVVGDKPGQSGNRFEWDVAPLPMYKQYDENGDITVHGVQAGHSGSVAICINAKSKKKNAAWKFLEFIGGSEGQLAQSESGFAIPSQKSLAKTDSFLQPGRNPRNATVFVDAAEYETPGDWWYLADKLWIDDWAGVLNGDVRNGVKTLAEFEASQQYTGTYAKLKKYTQK